MTIVQKTIIYEKDETKIVVFSRRKKRRKRLIE
jgi:hypothetical protein